ncbi:DUF6065 family protein [Aerosakkonema funiforme]|uniref:Uncharacterized protein n=1 Tax=Aerosakkonema funiforme FACHB-1375 TaxID=2949571 RepID=A0A926VAV8_9CYAN|nr:DUF6065 family protein [Aerosakkonema funiforme]MBD2180401.1 hypothetical protein [Aerosakkonema funiforme FACHB-1375]
MNSNYNFPEKRLIPPENLPDNLEVPDNTILVIPDQGVFKNPDNLKKLDQKRDWFNQHFYFCLPLTFGNQHGFVVVATSDLVIRWDGTNSVSGLYIHQIGDVPNPNFLTVKSHFGSGILTVHPRYMFRTPKNVNLMVKEPPNYPVDGLSWMNAVVETDNLRRDFTFNIKVTRANYDIYIKKGMPLGCILPYPRYFIDNYKLEELTNTEQLEVARQTMQYFSKERSEIDRGMPGLRYMNGEDIYGIKFDHHQKVLDNGKWWEQVKDKT